MAKNDTASAIVSGLRAVTRDWAKQRKSEERDASRRTYRYDRLVRRREQSIKEVAYEVMQQAYLKASANGTLPATARQVMYAARPLIQQRTDKQLDDQYFTQQLLPDYMNEHRVAWDVVFDDRGHFHEPHTGRSIGLGTLAVRDYLGKIGSPEFEEGGFSRAAIKTYGPECRFGAVLFLEKEGFLPLLRQAGIAQRYDLAIMSTKGVSNTAARKLVDQMCGQHQIPLLVLHDFDKSGFSILGTLKQSNRRYLFRNQIKIIDLGLRLPDIDGLEAEEVFDRGSSRAIRENLRVNGATAEEIEFLLAGRVELNALASDELIAFIERKLTGHGIVKVIPTNERLIEAYKLVLRSAQIEKIVETALEQQDDHTIEAPADLEDRIRNYIKEHPEARWDRAVSAIAGANDDREDEVQEDEGDYDVEEEAP
jgi:DNA topoisomerase VI subunit A